mgnify:CR=1 FL=1
MDAHTNPRSTIRNAISLGGAGASVTVNGEVRRLERQSPLVSALRTAQRDQWRLGVYAPRPATDRVGRAAAEVLGLDADGLVTAVRGAVPTTLDEFSDGR